MMRTDYPNHNIKRQQRGVAGKRRPAERSMVINHENLDDKIYTRLKTMIAKGQIEPGERIQPENLARDMGVSRTPILNALKRLAQERLVEWVPRRGIYVKKLTKWEVAQLFEVREGLESIAARLAATRIDPKEVDELEEMFREFYENPNSAHIHRYIERDQYFHWRLVELADNAHLAAAMESVNMMISAYQIGIPRTLPEVLPEHRAIFEALRQQNPDASEEAMRIHIRRSVERLKKDAESEGVLDMRASKDEKK